MSTMTFAELKRKSFSNSKDLEKVVINGILHEWVGIGWVSLGEPTEEDLKKYPTIID